MKRDRVNFLAVNMRSVINVLVSFLSVSIISHNLGIDIYAQVAVILSFLTVFTIIGNAVVDACIKYILKGAKEEDWELSSSYFSAAIIIVVCLFVIMALAITAVVLFDANFFMAGEGALYPLLFLIAAIFTVLSGIFWVGAFATENFVIPAVFRSAGRLIYLFLLFVFIVFFNFHSWSIGIAQIIAALFLLIFMYFNLKKNLPKLQVDFSLLTVNKMLLMLASIGSMSLVYIGIYLSGSFALLISRIQGVSKNELIMLAVSISIAAIVNQFLSTFAFLSTPKIHKKYAEDNVSESKQVVINMFSVVMASLFIALMGIYLVGQEIFSLWLGYPVTSVMLLSILAASLSYGISVLSIPLSQYFAAGNNLKFFGWMSLIEGGVNVALFYLILNAVKDDIRIFYVLLSPAIVGLVKLIFSWLYAQLSGDGVKLEKPLGILLLGLIIVSYMFFISTPLMHTSVLLKLIILGLPGIVYLIYIVKFLGVK